MKKSLITTKNLLLKYKWNSIFFKYLKYTLCFFIIPSLILCLIFYNSNSKTIHKNAQIQAEQNAQKCFNAIENLVTEVTNTYSIIRNDTNVEAYIHSPKIEEKTKNDYEIYGNIQKLLKRNIQTATYIKTINIYSLKSDYVLSTSNSNYYKNFHNKDLFSPFLDDKKMVYIIPTQYSETSKTYETITFGYAILSGSDTVGIITISINWDKINNLITSNDNEALFLINNNKIFFSSNFDYINKRIDNEKIHSFKNYPYFETIQNKEDIICITNLATGINIIYKNNMSFIADANNRLVFLGLILLLFAVLIPLFLSFYSSFLIYKSIIKIMEIFHKDENSESNDNFNEIEFISNNLLSISKAKEDIEKEFARNVATLKATQATALQMQINPHFLFNTLNVVNIIIMDHLKCENDAQKVISLLSSFLNDVLSSNETITELSNEINNLKKYTEIELIKNNYDFDVVWDIADETLNLKTVKFILQPIVENAIQHGIKPIEDIKGIIKIETKISNKQLKIKVHNNGKIISHEKLKEIRGNLLLNDMPKNHIGLYNVNQRIKIIYGEKYGCKITSDKNGTVVTISQPLK